MGNKTEMQSGNMCDIETTNILNYIIPEDFVTIKAEGEKYAVFVHLFYVECLEMLVMYLKNVPRHVDICFSTNTEEKEKTIRAVCMQKLQRDVEVVQVQNRGRDVAAFFCAFRQKAQKYKYICFIHDKKGAQYENPEVGRQFAVHCYENLLGSATYIQNILSLFQRTPHVGMLMPTPPYHNNYYTCIGHEWSENYDTAKMLAKKWNLEGNIDKEKPLPAPFGTMFWMRTEALKKINEIDISYELFPEEPTNKTDGTIMHAIERLYPYFVQDAGFYAAWVSTIKNAEKEQKEYYGMLRDINRELIYQYGIMDREGLLNVIKGQGIATLIFNKSISMKKKIQMLMKRKMSEKAYLFLKKQIMGEN